jgi:hypothetical protein
MGSPESSFPAAGKQPLALVSTILTCVEQSMADWAAGVSQACQLAVTEFLHRVSVKELATTTSHPLFDLSPTIRLLFPQAEGKGERDDRDGTLQEGTLPVTTCNPILID